MSHAVGNTAQTRDPGRLAVTIALQTDKPTPAYRRLAVAVEVLGFDGLTVFADLGYQPPLPALLAAAAATDRIRLGVSGYSPEMLHPVEIAGQYAVLDDASGGRGYLGLVRGSWLDRIGLHPGRGLRRLVEAVIVIRKLLAGDDSGYDGEIFQLAQGFGLRFPLPAAPPPVVVGTWSPRTAAWAAQFADEVKVGGTANPAMAGLMKTWLRAGAADSRRPPAVVTGAVTVVDTDRGAARDRARREVAMYLDVVAGFDRTVSVDPELLSRLRTRLRDGDREGAGALIPPDVLALFAFAGTPAEIIDQCAALAAAGVARVEFGTPHGVTDDMGIDLLGRRVLPALRELRVTP